jgi:hypothetical protein
MQDGLAAVDIRTLYETEDGSLLFGTGENAFSIYRGGIFSTFSIEHGLPGTSVRAFFLEDDGSLRVATDKGILTFTDSSKKIRISDEDQFTESASTNAARF